MSIGWFQENPDLEVSPDRLSPRGILARFPIVVCTKNILKYCNLLNGSIFTFNFKCWTGGDSVIHGGLHTDAGVAAILVFPTHPYVLEGLKIVAIKNLKNHQQFSNQHKNKKKEFLISLLSFFSTYFKDFSYLRHKNKH
jgi:hypothetical protein